jgi:predicted molibdopterin-dependent oxidoreductase YjgC
MKLIDGKYKRISWNTAIEEITAKMQELKKDNGPDSLFFIGSSKHNNEQAYLLRKFVSFLVRTIRITKLVFATPLLLPVLLTLGAMGR